MAASILAILLSAVLALVTIGCDGSSSGTEFVTRTASFGRWQDKRSSGSIIMHDMLVITEPRAYGSRGAPLGSYVVTTTGRMASKIDDILSDRVPTNPGVRMNFAVGDPIGVRIEKVVAGGKRELVAEARAGFLEVTR